MSQFSHTGSTSASNTNATTSDQGSSGKSGSLSNAFAPSAPNNHARTDVISNTTDGVTSFSSQPVLENGTVTNITNFVDVAQVLQDRSLSTNFLHNTSAYLTQSLSDVIERPYPVYEITWKSTTNAGDLMVGLPIASLLAANPNIERKLRNFRTGRFKLQIALRPNGSFFQYGRIIATWMPFYTKLQNPFNYLNLSTLTGMPHIATGPTINEVTNLEIPYIARKNYVMWSDTNEMTDYGTLLIMCMNKLSSLKSPVNDVSVQVWANFKDVELFAPHGIFTPPEGEFQSGVLGATTESITKSIKGIVSGVSSTVSGLDSVFSSVGSLGATVGAYFGLLDCPNTQQNQRFALLRQPRMTNGTGDNAVDVLALSPTARVIPGHNFMGSDHDQMDIMDIIQTPTFLKSFTWTSKLGDGARIGSIDLNPEFLEGSFINFLSRAFMASRGSLRVLVQVVCSVAHSGRFRVSHQPVDHQEHDYTMSELNNMVGMVQDIRTQTETPFVIPFLNTFTWDSRKSRPESPTSTWTPGFGRLYLNVMNELTSAESPVSDIYINLYISAGSDFQFTMPMGGELEYLPRPATDENDSGDHHLPHTTNVKKTGSPIDLLKSPPSPDIVVDNLICPHNSDADSDSGCCADDESSYEFQSGTSETLKNMPYSTFIQCSGFKDDTLCFGGDRITNLKTLLSRYSCLGLWYLPGNVSTLTISPMAGFTFMEHTALDVNKDRCQSWARYFATLFRFFRGSANYRFVKCQPATTTNQPIFAHLSYEPTASGSNFARIRYSATGGTFAAHLNSGLNGCEVVTNTNQTLSLNVPYHCSSNFLCTDSNFWDRNVYKPLLKVCTWEAEYLMVMESMGDDFTFGYRMGPPKFATESQDYLNALRADQTMKECLTKAYDALDQSYKQPVPRRR